MLRLAGAGPGKLPRVRDKIFESLDFAFLLKGN